MPIIALSPRLYPSVARSHRVEPGGRSSDADQENLAAEAARRVPPRRSQVPPTDSSVVVDALLDALDDAELEALEELDTEDIEKLARKLQLKGVRRAHSRGFLDIAV